MFARRFEFETPREPSPAAVDGARRQPSAMMNAARAQRSLRYGIGALLLLLTMHTAAWYVMTSRIEAAIPAFLSTAAEQGWQVQGRAPERAGWPWAPSVQLSQVVATRLLGNAAPGGAPGNTALRWTAERVDLTVPFLDPSTLLINPTGRQTAEFPSLPPLQLRAKLALVRVPLSNPAPATLDIHDLAVTAPGIDLQAQSVHAEIGPTAATLDAHGIEVRPPWQAPFDGPATATIRAATNLSLGATPASVWRSSGGQVDLSAFTAQWGPLTVTGNGTGRLDEQLQPEGRATLRVQGGLELLDAMARAGVIAPAPASAARAVLGLLVLTARGQAVTLPVALAGRTVTVAQFPLLRLPPLNWDAP